MATLEQLNATNEVSGRAWMSGYLHGLAREGYYFSISALERIDGETEPYRHEWEGQFTCGEGVMHNFHCYCGDPERDAILENSSPEKVYQLRMRADALRQLPPWDKFQFVEVK